VAIVLWDASALAKHFVTELGSQTVLNPESLQAVDVPTFLAASWFLRQWDRKQTAFGRLV
jgi:hypothetical protein